MNLSATTTMPVWQSLAYGVGFGLLSLLILSGISWLSAIGLVALAVAAYLFWKYDVRRTGSPSREWDMTSVSTTDLYAAFMLPAIVFAGVSVSEILRSDWLPMPLSFTLAGVALAAGWATAFYVASIEFRRSGRRRASRALQHTGDEVVTPARVSTAQQERSLLRALLELGAVADLQVGVAWLAENADQPADQLLQRCAALEKTGLVQLASHDSARLVSLTAPGVRVLHSIGVSV